MLRLAQFNRKRGTSRQGGALFGLAEGSRPASISCPELPFSSLGEVSALLAHFFFFFFLPPTQSKGRAGLHMPNRFIK